MYHRLYIEYLYYFNVERDYYECHEVMEEYWLREGKNRLLQSLLQVAVGLYHFRNGNISGAIKLFKQSLDKKDEKWTGPLSINLSKLYEEVTVYFEQLQRYNEQPFTFYDLTIEITDPILEQLVATCTPEGVAEEDKF
jgi:uncharacterized protein